MRGRRDRHKLARHVEAGLGERLDDVREERRVDLAHVEPDATATARREQRVDRAADLIARRELVDEALTVVVEQQAAFAADRLRHQEALATRHPDHRRRVKLHELEVRELRPRGVGEQHPRPERARRVRRSRPQRGGPTGADHDGTGMHPPPVVAAHARTASVRGQERGGARVLEDRDPRLGGGERRKLADDAPPGRTAAGVHDPSHRVAAFEPESKLAVAVRVEVHTESFELANARRRLGAEDARSRLAHERPPRDLRVAQVGLEAVLDRKRGRQAALRPVARGLRERRGREQRDRRPSAAATSDT